jgi:hypothetical protein
VAFAREIVDFETARGVHDAIVDAEEKSDVEISGLRESPKSHPGFNNRGVVVLEKKDAKIDEQDLDDIT